LNYIRENCPNLPIPPFPPYVSISERGNIV
jgi:hypothetical protein